VFVEMWLLGAVGNAVDYFASRWIIDRAHLLTLNDPALKFNLELNTIPNFLMRSFSNNPLIPFLIIQVFLLAFFYFVNDNVISAFVSGALCMAGYYSLIQAVDVSDRLTCVKSLELQSVIYSGGV